MSDCQHERIQTWRFEDGEPANLWSCVDCGRKFVPLDIKQEQDAKRYRLLRRGQHWSVINGIGDDLRAEDLDFALDAKL